MFDCPQWQEAWERHFNPRSHLVGCGCMWLPTWKFYFKFVLARVQACSVLTPTSLIYCPSLSLGAAWPMDTKSRFFILFFGQKKKKNLTLNVAHSSKTRWVLNRQRPSCLENLTTPGTLSKKRFVHEDDQAWCGWASREAVELWPVLPTSLPKRKDYHNHTFADQCGQHHYHHYQKGKINTTIHLLTIVILILVFPNQEDSVTHPTM